MIRRPAVAGVFYPDDPDSLRADLAALLEGARRDGGRPRALLVPHAGYVYSGRIAGRTYADSPLPRRHVILCPNHTGRGESIAVDPEGEWATPLGNVAIDAALAARLLEACPEARVDRRAHEREHALEVQLPFLQHLLGADLRFVPVCVALRPLADLLRLGAGIASAIDGEDDVAVIISSDLSHYVPAEVAARLDGLAIERVLSLDPRGLHDVVMREEISMCGIAPAVAGLEAVNRCGARAARLVAYGHSGETSGDDRSVVGYAGIAVT